MRALILTTLLTLGISAQANSTLGMEKGIHHFAKSNVTLKTTSTFTFYDYGEPTVRFHESLDEVILSKEQSRKLHPALKGFYKTKKQGSVLKAALNTNFFGFVDNIVEITCKTEESCTLSYNQDLKAEFLVDGINPKFHAGLIGTTVNNFGTKTIAEAKDALISLRERGSLTRVISFGDYSKKDSFDLALQNGALAGLLKEANLCDQFVVHRCGTYCGRGNAPRSSRDTKVVGTCIIKLEK